jgi:hypothetical protein
MARSKYSFDEKKIERYVKEGRGKGRGAEYKPWLTIQDVPSSGRSHRILGSKTGRIHHLLSDIELNAFFVFDWADAIEDIREQSPLDRQKTRQIAEQIGIQHPCDRQTRTPLVMTTDLVLDVKRDGRLVTIARAIKPAKELDKPRTIKNSKSNDAIGPRRA